jgi:hypothetical protein
MVYVLNVQRPSIKIGGCEGGDTIEFMTVVTATYYKERR